MKLYFAAGACSLADHIALIEAKLPYALDKVDLKTKRTEHGEDFSEINPKGYVPALELDDGQILTENIAVLGYIADAGEGLTPSPGLARWRVLEMTAFISTELHKNFKPFFTAGASESDKQAARDILNRRFALLEDSLGGRGFIVGDSFTVADCYLFVMLRWAKKTPGIVLPPRLGGYHERMRERPSVQRAFREEGLN